MACLKQPATLYIQTLLKNEWNSAIDRILSLCLACDTFVKFVLDSCSV